MLRNIKQVALVASPMVLLGGGLSWSEKAEEGGKGDWRSHTSGKVPNSEHDHGTATASQPMNLYRNHKPLGHACTKRGSFVRGEVIPQYDSVIIILPRQDKEYIHIILSIPFTHAFVFITVLCVFQGVQSSRFLLGPLILH